jgi:hypothetical protein
MNPLALKAAIEEATRAAGLPVPKVAAIVGDDLVGQAHDLKASGKLKPFSLEGEEEPLFPDDKMLMSFNAYLGARPIAEALSKGAQVVVTGTSSSIDSLSLSSSFSSSSSSSIYSSI